MTSKPKLPQMTVSRNINALLPPELFQMIFAIATAGLEDSSYPGEFVPVDRRVRHSITAVCRLWRVVALRTSSLWCRIEACQDEGGVERPSTSLLLLDCERAGTRPLIVRLHSFQTDKAQSVFTMIRNVSARCQSLCLDKTTMAAFIYFLDPPDRDYTSLDLSLLHTLVLKCLPARVFARESLAPMHILDLSTAHQLSHLVFHGWGNPINIHAISRTNLVSLDLVYTMDAGNDIAIIQACPKLENLKWAFDYEEISQSHALQLAQIELTSLRRLSYDPTAPRISPEDNTLLPSLRAPNLNELTLLGDVEAIPSYNQFPKLQHLFFFNDHIGNRAIDIIHNVPSIVNLAIRPHRRHSTEIEDAFSKRSDYGVPELAGQLEELTMQLSSHEIGEAIILLRNNGLPEGPEMPFVLHLPKDERVSETMAAWIQSRPFSIDRKGTRLDLQSERSWSILAKGVGY